MIRMIAAVLLAVNLALFFWIQKQQGNERDQLPVAGGDLKLLSEARPASAEPPSAEAPKQEAPKPIEPPMAEPPAQVSTPPAPETKPATPEMATQVVTSQTPDPPKAAAVTQPAPQPEPSKPAASTVPAVLADTPAKPASTVAEQPAPPEPVISPPKPVATEPKPARLTCYSFGPIEEQLAAIGIMARIKDQTSKQDIRQEGAKISEGFRVLIRTATNEEEARALEQRLQQAGLTDIWRISRGEDKDAISMGMYSQRANAAKRAEQATKLGFDAKIEEKGADKTQFWVDFASEQERLSATDLGLNPGPGQSLRVRPCNGKGGRRH